MRVGGLVSEDVMMRVIVMVKLSEVCIRYRRK